MSGGWHVFWFIITILTGGFGLIFWVIFALCAGSSNRKKSERKKDEEISLLKELVENSKRNQK